jgi:hypothetical protein
MNARKELHDLMETLLQAPERASSKPAITLDWADNQNRRTMNFSGPSGTDVNFRHSINRMLMSGVQAANGVTCDIELIPEVVQGLSYTSRSTRKAKIGPNVHGMIDFISRFYRVLSAKFTTDHFAVMSSDAASFNIWWKYMQGADSVVRGSAYEQSEALFLEESDNTRFGLIQVQCPMEQFLSMEPYCFFPETVSTVTGEWVSNPQCEAKLWRKVKGGYTRTRCTSMVAHYHTPFSLRGDDFTVYNKAAYVPSPQLISFIEKSNREIMDDPSWSYFSANGFEELSSIAVSVENYGNPILFKDQYGILLDRDCQTKRYCAYAAKADYYGAEVDRLDQLSSKDLRVMKDRELASRQHTALLKSLNKIQRILDIYEEMFQAEFVYRLQHDDSLWENDSRSGTFTEALANGLRWHQFWGDQDGFLSTLSEGLPVPTISVPQPKVVLKVRLPMGKGINNDIKKYIADLYITNRGTSRQITCLAPEAAYNTVTHTVCAMDQESEKKLVQLMLAKKDSPGKSVFFPPELQAWRFLIITHNELAKEGKYPLLPIDRRLAFSVSNQARSKKENISKVTTGKVSEDKVAALEEVVATMSIGTNQTMEAVLLLAKQVQTLTEVRSREEARSGSAAVSEAAEELVSAERARIALLEEEIRQIKMSRQSTPRPPSPAKSEEYAEFPEYSFDDFRGVPSGLTHKGVLWEEYDPSKLQPGTAYVIARNPVDNRVYRYPTPCMLPDSSSAVVADHLVFGEGMPGEGNTQRASEKKPQGKSSTPPQKPPAESGAAAADQQLVQVKIQLSGFFCPSCQQPRTSGHKISCPLSLTSQFVKLSEEGKKARDEWIKSGNKKVTDNLSQPTPPKGKEEKGKKDNLEKDDPLKVRLNISDDERKALIEYFGLPPRPSKDELDALPVKERAAAIKASTVPKWAVRAVLNNPANLESILSGDLTMDKFQVTQNSGKNSTPAASTASGSTQRYQVVQAWSEVKAKHPNVALCNRPRTADEKSYRKDYDAFRTKYGKSADGVTPKLRESSSSEPPSRDQSRGRSTSRANQRDGGSSSKGMDMSSILAAQLSMQSDMLKFVLRTSGRDRSRSRSRSPSRRRRRRD